MRPIPVRLCMTAALLVAVAAGGCYEEISDDTQPSASTTVEPAPAPVQTAGGASGSALGGAKRSAQNTVDKVEQRQQRMLKQMEEDDDDE